MKFALRRASVAGTMTTVSSPVLLMSGLPACGKTTMAERLSARLGAVLIRQCDVYARLGIDLRSWIRRTEGFTRDVAAYERLRDDAYVETRPSFGEDLTQLFNVLTGYTRPRRFHHLLVAPASAST
jgi:hypothetical protein